MARTLLEGDALAKFNERATANRNETNDHFVTTLREVTTHVFPKKALALQKRYMRRFMRTQDKTLCRTRHGTEQLLEAVSAFRRRPVNPTRRTHGHF